ncbi:hypothetical protein BC826DRAFT_540658 [Russula brevipes]|nr:hypothetical protein BC826DRAFT_540658 [Russula brevipes]
MAFIRRRVSTLLKHIQPCRLHNSRTVRIGLGNRHLRRSHTASSPTWDHQWSKSDATARLLVRTGPANEQPNHALSRHLSEDVRRDIPAHSRPTPACRKPVDIPQAPVVTSGDPGRVARQPPRRRSPPWARRRRRQTTEVGAQRRRSHRITSRAYSGVRGVARPLARLPRLAPPPRAHQALLLPNLGPASSSSSSPTSTAPRSNADPAFDAGYTAYEIGSYKCICVSGIVVRGPSLPGPSVFFIFIFNRRELCFALARWLVCLQVAARSRAPISASSHACKKQHPTKLIEPPTPLKPVPHLFCRPQKNQKPIADDVPPSSLAKIDDARRRPRRGRVRVRECFRWRDGGRAGRGHLAVSRDEGA